MRDSITQKLQEFPIEVLSKLAVEEEILVDDSMTKDHIINLLLDKPIEELSLIENLLDRAVKYKEYQELSTYLESVPKEIRVQILMQLEPGTLLAFCQTNKSWYQLCKSDAMNDYWKHQTYSYSRKCGSEMDIESSLQQKNFEWQTRYATWYQLYLDCLQDTERVRVLRKFIGQLNMESSHEKKIQIAEKFFDFLIKHKQFVYRHENFGSTVERKLKEFYYHPISPWKQARDYYRQLFHADIHPLPTASATFLGMVEESNS